MTCIAGVILPVCRL